MKMKPRTKIEASGLLRVVEGPPWFTHFGNLLSSTKLQK